MNIGEVITGPMQDPDWMKKLFKASILTFLVCLTIVGIFVAMPNLLGWSKLVTQARLRGDTTLPEFSFGNIGEGWRILIGYFIFGLLVIVAVLPIALVFAGGAAVLGKIAAPLAMIWGLLGMLAYLAFAILVGLASPIIAGRIILDGDTTGGVGLLGALQLARANIGVCLMYFVAVICVQLVASVLGAIPFIGALAMICGGIAYISAAQGIALAQFRQTGVQ